MHSNDPKITSATEAMLQQRHLIQLRKQVSDKLAAEIAEYTKKLFQDEVVLDLDEWRIIKSKFTMILKESPEFDLVHAPCNEFVDRLDQRCRACAKKVPYGVLGAKDLMSK